MALIASELFSRPPALGVMEQLEKLRAQEHRLAATTYRRRWFKLRKLLAKTQEWHELRQSASRRAQSWCEKCHKRYGSQVHHVKTVHSRLDLVWDLDNVQWICEPCHKGCHK